MSAAPSDDELGPERAQIRRDAIAAAGAIFAASLAAQDSRSPRAAAEAAWRPGGPDVDRLEALIRAERGLPARPQ